MFTNKENLAYVCGLLLVHVDNAQELVADHFKTATDVLRLAVGLSGGDVSLAANTKFKNFRRSERRFLLNLLEQRPAIVEDMLRYKKRWIRLGEKLHPTEYQHVYPKVAEALDVIRNDKPFATFNNILEAALERKEFSKAVEQLQTRPGEFARRLDFLLRSAEDPSTVLEPFAKVVGQVSTNVLLQNLAHFKGRLEPRDLRVFFPKGEVAKAYGIPNALPELSREVCDALVELIRQALIDRFGKLSELGKVYINPRLDSYTVPLAQRSASKSLRNLARGSRFPMPGKNTIRFFLWWKEGIVNGVSTGRVDIDLSAVFYDENWKYLNHVSYTNLKSKRMGVFHSGDITSAPFGACEFIDIDINKSLSQQSRYVVMSLYSFSGQPYCNLPECYAGWMMRKSPDSGEIFEPSTVSEKIDIASNTSICIPVILDLKERQFIWTDLALTRNPYWYNNVEGNEKGIVLIGKAMTGLQAPKLYDLFELHALGRGQIVSEKENAETVFSIEEGITPYDTETILAEYL